MFRQLIPDRMHKAQTLDEQEVLAGTSQQSTPVQFPSPQEHDLASSTTTIHPLKPIASLRLTCHTWLSYDILQNNTQYLSRFESENRHYL